MSPLPFLKPRTTLFRKPPTQVLISIDDLTSWCATNQNLDIVSSGYAAVPKPLSQARQELEKVTGSGQEGNINGKHPPSHFPPVHDAFIRHFED